MRRTISLLVLAGLIAGILAGAWVRTEAPQLTQAAGVLEAFGGLWLNALRMTVVPLVAALLITGIASVVWAKARRLRWICLATSRSASRAPWRSNLLMTTTSAKSSMSIFSSWLAAPNSGVMT